MTYRIDGSLDVIDEGPWNIWRKKKRKKKHTHTALQAFNSTLQSWTKWPKWGCKWDQTESALMPEYLFLLLTTNDTYLYGQRWLIRLISARTTTLFY